MTEPFQGEGSNRATALISAHRGGGESHPAATYEAYSDAVDSGAEFAEFDIRRLNDGALVVYHDDQVPDGPKLSTLSYLQLTRLVGYEVPLVDRVLKTISGRLHGHLDLKEVGYESEVIELAQQHLGDDFIATSLEDASILAIKSRFPETKTALSLGRDLEEFSRFAALAIRYREFYPRQRIHRCHADGIAAHQRIARLKGLSLANHMGIFAMVWTVDDDDLMKSLLADPRVAILITNRPRRAVEIRNALDRGTSSS